MIMLRWKTQSAPKSLVSWSGYVFAECTGLPMVDPIEIYGSTFHPSSMIQ